MNADRNSPAQRNVPGHQLHAVICLLCFVMAASHVSGADRVKASLESDSAWTGQAVTMVITLYSPGPFSGTASMDLPEIPKTFFVRNGNPVVGSETVEGESLLTQRHEFHIFTQQTGKVIIPAFEIRFEGKKDFLSDAEPVSGRTTELSFESKRPPARTTSGVVIAVNKLEVAQTWEPNEPKQLQAGDVIRRTLNQKAAGTTAMMLQQITATGLDGVRLYTERPEVIDKNNRGDTTATRTDVIKYQFERAGTFELPPVEVVWFNLATEEIERETLAGLSVSVSGSSAATVPEESTDHNKSSPANLLMVFTIGLVLLVVAYQPLRLLMKTWKARRNQPEAVLARAISQACRDNDAGAAYASVIQWQRLVSFSDPDSELQRELSKLAGELFGRSPSGQAWSGVSLQKAFTLARGQQRTTAHQRRVSFDLPALNPALPD